MINKLKNIAAEFLTSTSKEEGSFNASQDTTESFKKDPDNPFLISFPRTGSHWLRMIMELYFEKPGLVRIFFYEHAKNFTCLHTHDLELDVKRNNVIYLYREPVDTVFSQLSYHKENIHDPARIQYWSELYGKHLSKWLFEEKFTSKKTIITYEGLRNDLCSEFKKICGHLGFDLDPVRLKDVSSRITKESLKKKTAHDNQVINLSDNYNQKRDLFYREQSKYVFECVVSQSSRLKNIFKGSYE